MNQVFKTEFLIISRFLKVTSLRIGVSLKNYSLDDFLKKNYRKFGVTCDESSDKAVAQTLHKVLEVRKNSNSQRSRLGMVARSTRNR